ncbi:amidohydrolase [Neobacillus kokaensis]|uniref:Amidohydrolase n=1 Tax=Neobacillus kokaensis TaxID=2759023 RepID=A0ABQ3N5E8_9BACI|nr:amidohydrolase [Neobacillus kokaensis]GHH99894.1 amidohydrolase [Neobacillus kokaensis]
MKKLSVIFTLFLLFSMVSGTTFASNFKEKEEMADTVYLNGNIYTVDKKFSKAKAMAIKGQKLIYVGNKGQAKKYIGANTKVVDLEGKTVIPGLNDGHLHFPRIGINLLKIDGFNKPKEEILNLVKEEANRLKPGEWILGFGWNHELWPDKKFPTKEELDAVAPDNPVVLTRVDAHSIWVNSQALVIGGITKETPDPQGGEIIRDSNGEPTGVLIDTAGTPVTSKIPPYSTERVEEGLLKAQEELFKNGITSATDAGSHLIDINSMKNLYKQGDLKVRLNVMVANGVGGATGESLEHYYKHGPEIGLFGDRLTVRSLKLVGDGSLGSRSAALLEDYSDRPGHKGNYRFTDEELYRLVKEARKYGWQVAAHAIGDGAIEQVINTYERVLKEEPLKDHRWRIEHFQVANASEIQRIAELGILPSMQPVHATSDKNMAEDRVGPERIKYSYAWRKVIDAGSHIVGGSDAPVELVNPFHGLYAAVTRMDRDGEPDGGWYSEESMTREEALKAFTIWAAEGSFEEKIKGSLEAGKLADFLVVDRDPMECPEELLKDIQVLSTVLGGDVVYKK